MQCAGTFITLSTTDRRCSIAISSHASQPGEGYDDPAPARIPCHQVNPSPPPTHPTHPASAVQRRACWGAFGLECRAGTVGTIAVISWHRCAAQILQKGQPKCAFGTFVAQAQSAASAKQRATLNSPPCQTPRGMMQPTLQVGGDAARSQSGVASGQRQASPPVPQAWVPLQSACRRGDLK